MNFRLTVGAIAAGLLFNCACLASEVKVQVQGPSGLLGGLLEEPQQGPGTARAIIVPGSGNIDLNGNGPRIHTGLYELLAKALAGNGIQTIRIDKRGLFSSSGAAPDANAVTIQDYAADVGAWLDFAHTRGAARCSWLIGHSEGGLIALLTATARKDVCGVILLATAGIPMGELLRRQLQDNPANASLLPEANRIIDSLEGGHRVDVSAVEEHLRGLFRPRVQDLLISEFSLNPVGLAAKANVPVYVIYGDRDVQVSPKDVAPFKTAGPNVVVMQITGANHVFKAVDGSPEDNLKSMQDPDLPLVPALPDMIAKALHDKSH
jgi:pimeloyl-ACP methyl ester carboxylesterase